MKTLVAYFSASGATARAAQGLARAAGADLYQIVPAETYSAADLDWTNKKNRSSVENVNESARPALKDSPLDLSGYNRIYLGFPIWWGVAPKVVDTFIDQNDLAGKQIYVFATSGGSGVGAAVRDLQSRYPQLGFAGGKLLNGPVSSDVFA